MTTLLKRFLITTSIAMGIGIASTQAQVIVRVRPTHEVVVRPVAPSPRHVWVDEEWRARNGRYEYVHGYWAEPRPGFHVWVRGHWVARRHGYYWVPGHWAR